MAKGQNIYLASDFHLGIPDRISSLEREKRIVAWLNFIAPQAAEIHLVGDIFDFWFEYRSTVPKGFVRLLGRLAELSDSGILIHIYTGNHDMWMFDYLATELNAKLHKAPVHRDFHGRRYFIGHGDGLGPGDNGYKIMKIVFANSACQWLFARLHPNFGFALARYWSGKSRNSESNQRPIFKGKENEWLFHYCNQMLKKSPAISAFIFGHRHLPLELELNDRAVYINLGDWLTHNTYCEISAEGHRLLYYEPILTAKSNNLAE